MPENQDCFILALIPKQPIFKGEVQVSQFPFKVGRREPPFREFSKCGPEGKMAIGKISREHATIAYDGSTFTVCDHGSLNGTYVNRKRIEVDTVTTLEDGDTLGFSEYVEFVVQIQQSMVGVSPIPPEEGGPIIMDPSPEPEPGAVRGSTQDPASEPGKGDGAGRSRDEAVAPGGQVQKPARRASAQLPKPSALKKEANLLDSLTAEASSMKKRPEPSKAPASKPAVEPRQPTRGRLGLAKVVAIVGVVVGICAWLVLSLVFNDARTIRKMVENKNYRMAMGFADAKLADESNPEIERYVLQAAIRELVENGDWCALLDAGDYGAALDNLHGIAGSAKHSGQLPKLVDFITLALDFIRCGERLQRTRMVRIYQDELRYEELLTRWEGRQKELRSMAELFKTLAPDCPDLLPLMTNHRSRMMEFKATMMEPVARLKRDLEAALQDGRGDNLETILDRFVTEAGQSRSAIGVDLTAVRSDANVYLSIVNAIEARDVFPLLEVNAARFQSPPFKMQAARLMENIPPKTVLDMFKKARTAWRTCNGDDAVRLLSTESAGAWQPEAVSLKTMFETKLKTIGRLRALNDPVAEKDWAFVVKAITRDLAGVDDAGYRRTFEATYVQALTLARHEASIAFDRARDRWKDYQAKGPIVQTHRLSSTVTDEYVALAKSLKKATEDVVRWKTLAETIAEPIARERLGFWKEVMTECRFQWRRMNEIKNEANASVVTEKIEYLPVPPDEWK